MSLSPWILSPLVWFFLPGYALAPARIGKPLHFLRVLGISFLITSGLSLLLVYFGSFNAKLVTVLLLVFLPVAVFRFWKSMRRAGGDRGAKAFVHEAFPFLLFAMLVLLLPVFNFIKFQFVPSQPYQGACDAGVYIAAAKHLEGTGNFDWKAGELLPLETTARSLSIRTTPYQYPWRETWPGIILVGDKIAPQFFPLYPVWLSLFRSAFGIHSIFCVNFFCLTLALMLLNILARSFLPWRYAWLPLLVLSLNPGIIHFWDYPLAEIFLAFIFTAMLAFLVYGLRCRIRSFLALAACFLAAGLATKYMAWFLLAPLALLWVLSDQKRFMARYFGIPLVLSGAFPLMCLKLWNYPHFLNHFLPQERLVQAGVFAFGLVLIWGIARMNPVRRRAPFAIGALLTLAVFAYLFVLPNASELGEENVLPELAWYTGWGWLVMAFVGCWVLLYRRRKDAKPILIFFLLMLGVAFAGTADNPLHPFAFRRHIPILLPLIALLAAVGLHWLQRLGRVALAAVVLLCAVPPLVLGLPMMSVGEGNGFLSLLTKISRELPAGPIFALDDAEWIASQAQLLAQKPVYPLHMESAGGLEAYQKYAAGQGSVKLFTGQALPYGKLGEWSGELEQLRQERNRRPSIIEKRMMRLFLYDISLERTRAGERMEVGGDDFGRVAGFWGPEKDGPRPFRWSRQWCHFILLTKGRIILTMNSAGHSEDPVPFRLYIGKELLAEDFATPGWRDYAVVLPQGLQGRQAAFSLVTHTFRPLPDTRDLGLMVSSIAAK